MLETVFEVFAEGGSLVIERQRDSDGDQFLYHHSEFYAGDEGLDVNINGKYDSFEQVFQLINSKYPWFQFHLESVHQDYRTYVTDELIKKLNDQYKTPKALIYSKEILEKTLKIKLEFGFAPIVSDFQNIKVTNLMKLTEYNYQEYTEESGKTDRIRGKYEIWTDDQQYSIQYNDIITHKYSFKTVGKLEVSGNTIILKDENDKIEFVFSSDKFFVSTSPILSSTKRWFYQNVF